MTQGLLFLYILPLIAGFLIALFKSDQKRAAFGLLLLSVSLITSIVLFIRPAGYFSLSLFEGFTLYFGLTLLSKTILIFVNLFGFLIALSSARYETLKKSRGYFSYLVWLVAFSNLAVVSMDFISFIFAWGALLVLLYAMLNLGSEFSAAKALTVVGFGDFSLLLGLCIYIAITKTTLMPQGGAVVLDSALSWTAYVLILSGAFAKAGCMPFHTWIPTAADSAPIPVMAIFPASLDKLLGIYLLARVTVDFFAQNMITQSLLLIVGSLTIIFAVLMALIQHDLRRLLSFHAISQVGYMVIGFGTGSLIGIAAGLFHMVNNCIYKSGLFLSGGVVGERKNNFNLDRLGGLAVFMPVTFICAVVFSLSISGVPPFNGFASKWMLYQGVLTGFSEAPNVGLKSLYIFALISAMFGSALTLASFIKFIHAIFLGESNDSNRKPVSDAGFRMGAPLVILAVFCLLLGILPGLFINNFIQPWLAGEVVFIGSWNSMLAFVLTAVGVFLGWIIYKLMNISNCRTDKLFIGGEDTDFGPSYPATEFYKTIYDVKLVKKLYAFLYLQGLDLYNLIDKFTGVCAGAVFAVLKSAARIFI